MKAFPLIIDFQSVSISNSLYIISERPRSNLYSYYSWKTLYLYASTNSSVTKILVCYWNNICLSSPLALLTWDHTKPHKTNESIHIFIYQFINSLVSVGNKSHSYSKIHTMNCTDSYVNVRTVKNERQQNTTNYMLYFMYFHVLGLLWDIKMPQLWANSALCSPHNYIPPKDTLVLVRSANTSLEITHTAFSNIQRDPSECSSPLTVEMQGCGIYRNSNQPPHRCINQPPRCCLVQ